LTAPEGRPTIYRSSLGAGSRFPAPFARASPILPEEIRGGQGVLTGLAEIKLQEGESIENALRRFKRKVQQEDIIKDIKKHSFYLKPGDKRRAKQALARKRSRKKLRREGE
jgi:small subunit ribosomal protein S21